MTKAQRAIMAKYSIPEEFHQLLIDLSLESMRGHTHRALAEEVRIMAKRFAGPFQRYASRLASEARARQDEWQETLDRAHARYSMRGALRPSAKHA